MSLTKIKPGDLVGLRLPDPAVRLVVTTVQINVVLFLEDEAGDAGAEDINIYFRICLERSSEDPRNIHRNANRDLLRMRAQDISVYFRIRVVRSLENPFKMQEDRGWILQKSVSWNLSIYSRDKYPKSRYLQMQGSPDPELSEICIPQICILHIFGYVLYL
ncbi:hypothetical protein XENOCAPTIV_013103 [Xenoophorus captivus]|uniref:Uncharacterized protein n=1 Tax=Xenoophorus captivus TaxID=1517983 RepID=A0ABV0QAP2_9TELE